MQNIESRKSGSSQPNVASSCGTGEASHRHAPDPAMADLREAKMRFNAGSSGKSGVSHIVDAGDSGGYVAPYEVDMDDDPAERPQKDNEAE